MLKAAYTFLLLLFLLPAGIAAAQQPAAPLPPPILVPNVDPPLTIPSEVVRELQNGRILCERKLAKFDINLNKLTRADINGDGAEDFIMSTGGYLCNGSNLEFASMTGDEYFIFASLPDGRYHQHNETIRAYDVKIDREFTPPHILFTVQCPHKLDMQNFGNTRLRWSDNQFKAVTRNTGCDGSAPDPSIAAAAAAGLPVTETPQAPKEPPRMYDFTGMGKDRTDNSSMTPEPAPTAVATPAIVTSPYTPPKPAGITAEDLLATPVKTLPPAAR